MKLFSLGWHSLRMYNKTIVITAKVFELDISTLGIHRYSVLLRIRSINIET